MLKLEVAVDLVGELDLMELCFVAFVEVVIFGVGVEVLSSLTIQVLFVVFLDGFCRQILVADIGSDFPQDFPCSEKS